MADKRLMDLFLRLYTISLQHHKAISECGVWEDGVSLNRHFEWRR